MPQHVQIYPRMQSQHDRGTVQSFQPEQAISTKERDLDVQIRALGDTDLPLWVDDEYP
jgi:hypothetical protein